MEDCQTGTIFHNLMVKHSKLSGSYSVHLELKIDIDTDKTLKSCETIKLWDAHNGCHVAVCTISSYV